MRRDEAAIYIGEVAEQIGVPVTVVRIEPIPFGMMSVRLKGDHLIVGPALVDTLSKEALAFAVVMYLKSSFRQPPYAIFGVSAVLALSSGAATLWTTGLTLAGFLMAIPITFAATVLYSMLLMIPVNEFQTKAAHRAGLQIAGLAGAEEYVRQSFRYFLGGDQPADRDLQGDPSSKVNQLRVLAKRMNLA